MFFLSQASASTFMPVQGTRIAESVDKLYSFLLICSAISCVLVIGGLIYFVLKYRRRGDNDKTAYISHNALLEFAWSFIPFVFFMIMFGWGAWVYWQMRHAPDDALEVHVSGRKWEWSFIYKNGRQTVKELYVPLNRPVKLIMSSQDVIHSFYIPAFRTKQDVVPGMYSSLWFQADKIGNFQVFCAEYCGDSHSDMMAKIHVLPQDKFDEWLSRDPEAEMELKYKGLSLVDIGKKVFQDRCVACHNLDNQRKVGPGLAQIWGRDEKISGGGSVMVDENYIRESIMNPQAKIVAGYEGLVMPPFQGQLQEKEVLGLLELIKSIK